MERKDSVKAGLAAAAAGLVFSLPLLLSNQATSSAGPFDLDTVIGPAALYAGESMLLFTFAAAVVEKAFDLGLDSVGLLAWKTCTPASVGLLTWKTCTPASVGLLAWQDLHAYQRWPASVACKTCTPASTTLSLPPRWQLAWHDLPVLQAWTRIIMVRVGQCRTNAPYVSAFWQGKYNTCGVYVYGKPTLTTVLAWMRCLPRPGWIGGSSQFGATACSLSLLACVQVDPKWDQPFLQVWGLYDLQTNGALLPQLMRVALHCQHALFFCFLDARALQGVSLQPKTLDDWLLVKLSQPASKFGTNSGKNVEDVYES
eukprot:51397-Pelagomonas_calceolata.AAC.1